MMSESTAAVSADVQTSLYNLEEAATYLHTSKRHIQRLVEEKRISFSKVGRFVMFREADLIAFLDKNHVEAK